MSKLIYREIRAEDNSRLRNIIRFNLKAHHLDIPGTVYFDDNLGHLSDFYLENPGKRYYAIALDETGEIIGGIGFAEFPYFEECAELQKLYLTDSAKGKGLGYEMIQLIETKATEYGYKQMYLETHTNLEAAIHIYEKCGYKEIPKPQSVVHGGMNRFYLKALQR